MCAGSLTTSARLPHIGASASDAAASPTHTTKATNVVITARLDFTRSLQRLSDGRESKPSASERCCDAAPSAHLAETVKLGRGVS
jgi:hypothetical protein